MFVKKIEYDNFRNFEKISFEPSENINVICGDNAQGKTNLIEAIYLFSGQKSFRAVKDTQLVNINNPQNPAVLKMDFFAAGRNQKAKLVIDSKRHCSVNGIPLESPAYLAESFCCVVFSPLDMDIIKDGPAIRRKFIDNAISMIRPKYEKMLSVYNRAVAQRNAVLRDVMFHSELEFMLDSFEQRIAKAGEYITQQRRKYIEAIMEFAPEIYGGMSENKEKIEITYKCSYKNGSFDDLLEGLHYNRAEDTKNLSTGIGPHRDDIEFFINNLAVKAFGSQGQKRSAVLTLKLSQAQILKRYSGEQPVAILDDVMSELDHSRQDYILNHIKGWQVFITCCDPNTVQRLNEGKCVKLCGGKLSD